MNDIIFSEDELGKMALKVIEYAEKVNLKVWAFYGAMGVGKTTLIKSVCLSLGVSENVSSPTFSIVNEYRNNQDEAIYHFDFYRLKNESEAVDIGCEEYFESGSLCLIEWPEKILNLLPQPLLKISLELNGTSRRINFSYD